MKEVDELAEGVARVVVRITALPLLIVPLVKKVGKPKLPKGLRALRLPSLKRRPAKVERQHKPSALDKFKLAYEDVRDKKQIKRSGKNNGRKLL